MKPRARHRLMAGALGAAFIASWAALAGGLFLTCERLRPACSSGDPAAWAVVAVLLPLAVFLVQGLWYVPRRPVGSPVFLRETGPAGPLVFLPLPFRSGAEAGPAFEAVTEPAEREALLAEARRRAGWPLSARLALLLEARSPLDLLFSGPAAGSQTWLARPARLIDQFFGPARQFLRLWGYYFFLAWRSGDDPGPVGEMTAEKRGRAGDLVRRAETLAAGADLERVRGALVRTYGRGETSPAEPDGQAGGLLNEPWLAPRYRGVYLDFPVTSAARTVDELYDGRGEEDPSLFYPPELGLEVELAARLMADRRRLAEISAARGTGGLVRLEGRLLAPWELAGAMFDLDDRIWRLGQRVAAHHRRCRSSHLAAARRCGKGWPEALRGLAGLVFFAEHCRDGLERARDESASGLTGPDPLKAAVRLHRALEDVRSHLAGLDLPDSLEARAPEFDWGAAWPAPTSSGLQAWRREWPGWLNRLDQALIHLKNRALTALLAAEDRVAGADASTVGEPPEWVAPPAVPFGPEPRRGQLPPGHGLVAAAGADIQSLSFFRPPEPPARVYFPAERFGIGLAPSLLAALVLGLFLWQGQTVGRSHLVVYNGLDREVTVSLNGRRLVLAAYGHERLALWPGREYRVVAAAGGRVVEAFSRRLEPRPATEIYNVAGASPLMEWWTSGSPAGRFLGRPRWLTTSARVFFREPAPDGETPELVLSGYGDSPPGEMLAAFADERDQDELVRLHARWDRPGSRWFWKWHLLALGRPDQAGLLLERLRDEPDFLLEAL